MPTEVTTPALSYVHGASDIPLLGVTIGQCLRDTAVRLPDQEALIVPKQGVRWSYSELVRHSETCARGLMALGVQKGDRVAIWAPNRAEWPALQFAAAMVGAILVNLNPAYRASELQYVLLQAGVSVLVFAPKVRRSDYLETLNGLMPGLTTLSTNPDVQDVLAASEETFPGLRALVVLDDAGEPVEAPGMWSWAALQDLASRVSPAELSAREAEQQFDDAVSLQYTSGTTGFPKGATLSHHNLINNGYFVGERMKFSPADRLCIPVPLYHCFGMVMGNLTCVAHGATMVYPNETFDAEATMQTVAAERCTALHGVPTMFIAELDLPNFDTYDLSSLRTGIMAGSPCPIEVMRAVQDRMHMPEVEIAYGMTETAPVSFQSRVGDPLEKRVTTVGTIMPHTECKVIDAATGAIVPRGTAGEVCTRGYCVMLGYWNDETATVKAIDAAGWMHSGDLGVLGEDGHLNIVGRIKDLIIRGGENLYPREIEEFLHTHPGIADAYVIGVPDRKYGEEIMAWIRLRPGVDLSEASVRQYCLERISHFKVPRYVRFVEEFPMTVTGKIQKFRMREIAIAELALERETVETA